MTISAPAAPAAPVAAPVPLEVTVNLNVQPQPGGWTVAQQAPAAQPVTPIAPVVPQPVAPVVPQPVVPQPVVPQPVAVQPTTAQSTVPTAPAVPLPAAGAGGGGGDGTPEQVGPATVTVTAPAPSGTQPTQPVPGATVAGGQTLVEGAGLRNARSRGWSSGASGKGVTDQSFARWRGSPVTVAGIWADTTAEVQTNLPSLADEYAAWTGDLDIAVGGTVLDSSESYAEAARGAYVDRWTTMARNLQKYRGDKPGTTYVRPFHEFNGSWYENWFVTPENVEDYKASFRLITKVIRENCPSCVIAWSPNNGSSPGAATIEAAYPGDDVVDVVSVDSYNANGNPVVTDQTSWDEYANATKDGDPVGVEAWRLFAERHGKPVAFSEWGLNPGGGGGDNPQYIQGMNAWMSQHAARPGAQDLSGAVLYDVYFNVEHGGSQGFLIKDGPNPASGQAYQSLRWGHGPAQPTQAAQPTQPLQPAEVMLAPSTNAVAPPLPATFTPATVTPAPTAVTTSTPPAVTSSGS